MSKRFTETAKWKDPWWRKLPTEYKALWQYLCDECDNSGVWTKDFEQVVFNIGKTVTEVDALKFFNESKERIIILNNGAYWLIRDFVSFQFGELKENSSRIHIHVLNLIKKHKETKGYPYPMGIDTHKDKNKVMDKNKDKDKYGEYVYLSDKETQTLIYDYGPSNAKEYIARLEEYIGTNPDKHDKKYTSHYHVILTWLRKDAVKKIPHILTKKEAEFSGPLVDPKVVHEMVQGLTKKLGGGHGPDNKTR